MIGDLEVCAIVPARGGSKGIPGKNLRLVGDRPLIVHTLGHALAAEAVDRVVVSTDDDEIAAVSRAHHAEVIERPAELSGDEASSESALIHALDVLAAGGYEPDVVVFLQATSPIRSADDVQHAVETLVDTGADSLFSAFEASAFVWRRSPAGPEPINYDPVHRPRRQDMTDHVVNENGSIYVFRPWVLRELGSRLGGRIAVHLMHPLSSFEIDEPDDLELLEGLWRLALDPGGLAGDLPAPS